MAASFKTWYLVVDGKMRDWAKVLLSTLDYQVDEPPKRPRLEEDVFTTVSFFNWLFMFRSEWPKLLPPVPKTQEIITEGNIGIYAGRDVPFGTSDFEWIVNEGNSFVDKTLLISDLLESSAHVFLVVRPRRFGKTTNLTMLRHFFACPIEPDNKNRRQELFRDSNIWREKREMFKEHFCKYPVIFISLKDFCHCYTWESMKQRLYRIVANLYEHHVYLLEILSQIQKDRFNCICSESAYPLLEDTLMELSKYLRIYYGYKCIILIDEYDHPLNVAFHHGFYNKAQRFFSSLLGGLLKDNSLNIYKALLVGVTYVAISDIMVYTMFDNLFSDKFGFTEEEVVMLLRHHQVDMKGVKEWYNSHSAANNISLYNPWSIIVFIHSRNFRRSLRQYW